MTITRTHTPTGLSYDGFGINGSDEFRSRLLTWAKVSGDHVLLEEERTQLGQQLVHRYNTHAALVQALSDLLSVMESSGYGKHVDQLIQQASRALHQALAAGKE